jgi:RNA polymerase sigma-70 factor, ECF subfamily
MAGPHRLDSGGLAEHLPPLYRAARAWTGSSADAEDLVQDTLVHVLARPRLVLGDDLAYLLRALHNTLQSRRRTAGRRPENVELTEDLAGRVRRDDPAGAAEDAEVLAAIAELPPEYRDALVAVDVAGLSYKEAARALGVAEGTVTSRLSRARDRLARRLGDEPQ